MTVPANVAPVIDLNGSAPGKTAVIGYGVGAAAKVIAPNATIANSDSTSLNGGTLTVAFTANGIASDQLTIQNQGTGLNEIGISGTNVTYGGTIIGTFAGGNNGTSLVVSFNAASSPAAAQALAEHILYSNTASSSLLARTVSFTLIDGGGTAGGGFDTDSATATIYPSGPLNPNDIVVYRVGDGSAALSSAATAVFLDEYTKTGTFVQTIAMPQADTDLTRILTTSGTAATGGVLGRSVDYRYLLLSGFDAAPDTFNPLSTTAGPIARDVGRVDAAGTVDTYTSLGNAFRGDNIRGVASIDGSAFYVAGGAASGTGGVQYVPFHGSATQVALGDYRSVTIDGGQLYADSTSDVVSIGNGLPTQASGTTSLGVALAGAHEYALLDRDTSVPGVDTLYVAEDGALLKYGLIGGTWTAEGSIAVGLAGLDTTLSGTSVIFYATTATTTANPSGNAIVTFTDTAAYNAPISATGVTTLATAAANTAFRGLSFAPSAPTITIASPVQWGHLTSHVTGQTAPTFTYDLYRESAAASATVQYTFTTNDSLTLTNPSGTATFAGGSLRTTITTSGTFTGSGASGSITLKLSNPSNGYVIGSPGIQVTQIGHAPDFSIVDLNGSATGTSGALSYTTGAAPTAIAPIATVADNGSGYAEKSLTVTFKANGTASDQLTIGNQGTAAGQIGVNGSALSYGGTAIGTFTGGVNGTALVVTFAPHTVTAPMAQALADQILYFNTSGSPSTAARTVSFALTDEGGTTNFRADTGTSTATIAINTAPVLGNAGHTTSYVAHAAPVAIEPALTLIDDTATQASATVTISTGFQSGDQLSATTVGTAITAAYNAATHVLALSGTDTLAHYQQVLDSVSFANTTNPDPTAAGAAASRTISFVSNDGTLDSAIVTSTLAITAPSNVPPALDLDSTVAGTGASLTILEGNSANVAPRATLTDGDSPDFGGGSLTVSYGAGATDSDALGVQDQGGVFATGGRIGVTGNAIYFDKVQFGTITSNGPGQPLTIAFDTHATPVAVQALLHAVIAVNFSDAPLPGSRPLTVTVNDGDGGSTSAVADVSITAVNNAPANHLPTGQSIDEDTPLIFGSAHGNAITISDVDAASGTVNISLSAANGTLVAPSNGSGATIVGGGFSPTLMVSGTIAQVNAALDGLVYTPALNYNGTDSIAVSTTDNGNTGSGGAQTTPGSIAVNVNSVNDAPTITAASNVNTTEQTAATIFAGVGVGDIDLDGLNGRAGDYTGAMFEVNRNAALNPEDIFSVVSGANFTVSGNNLLAGGQIFGTFQVFAAGLIRVSFTSAQTVATKALVEDVIHSIQYTNSGDAPPSSVVLYYRLTDGSPGNGQGPNAGGNNVAGQLVTVNIAAVNDAPTAVIGHSSVYTDGFGATEQVAVNLKSSLTIGDVDAGSGSVTVTLTANYGLITATAGGSGATVGGSGSNSVTITGTLAQVQVLLGSDATSTVTYTANTDTPPTTATLTLRIDDDGNTGTGGAQNGTDVATIHISAVDDAAVAKDDNVTTPENAVLNGNLFANNGHGIDSDVDGPTPAIAAVNGVAGNVGATITLASGANLTVNADGTFSYDPNGKFNYEVSSATAASTGATDYGTTDSFTYKLANGNTATVVVEVTGVDGAGDQLRGNSGDNIITGTENSDFFDLSQGGADKATGGAGNDAFSFGAAFGVGDTVDGGDGADTVGICGDYTGANQLTIAAGQLVNVETLSIQTSNTAEVGYEISWQDGNLARGQKMTIYAGNLQAGESVRFDGSAEAHGYFIMYGGLGTDDLKGGSGSDGFYFGPGKFTQADHVDGGGGAQNQLGLDGSYDLSSASALGTLGGNFTNIQTIVLYAGDPRDAANPAPNVYHIETNDAAVAASQTLTIWGTPVTSDLYFDGSAETDGRFNIYGGTGNDTLIGGQGDDLIYGGLGADTLKGGAGNDTFLYQDVLQSNEANTDHILDFHAGDKIDLSGIDSDTGTAGDQAFNFIGASAFTDHAGELRATFDAAHNYWIIEGDVNGDGVADLTIHVTTLNNHQIVATDFLP